MDTGIDRQIPFRFNQKYYKIGRDVLRLAAADFAAVPVFQDGDTAFHAFDESADIFLVREYDKACNQQRENPVHDFMLVPYP